MKNPILLVEPVEIHDYILKLWKSEAFRISHRDGGFINEQVDQFAKLPRLFCETTNDRLERAHFSTWWNAMMHRDYDNPVVHDLYWLHEFYHAGTMPYEKDMGQVAFNEKMERNELEASVCSEIQVYFEMPGLRASSFNETIYADRYLQDPDMQRFWQQDKVVALNTLLSARRNVMVGKPEHLMDMSERWIRRFAQQNAAYALVWGDRFNEIETHMVDFRSTTLAGDRRGALEQHAAWLEAEADKDPVDHIPFRQEAELATPFYWANKKKYAAEMKAAAARAPDPAPQPC